jgi:signal transduction histidine kinase
MLSNLIENAIKYGHDETPIQVTVKGDGSHRLCEVANQGAGIEALEQKSIFERLWRNIARRTDSSSSLGLGLYIVRQTVERHGGDIAVRSSQLQTVFTVRLPLRPPPEALEL